MHQLASVEKTAGWQFVFRPKGLAERSLTEVRFSNSYYNCILFSPGLSLFYLVAYVAEDRMQIPVFSASNNTNERQQ